MNSQLTIVGVDHPAIACEDVAAAVEWYCDVLAYELVERVNDTVTIIRAPDGTFIEMMQANDDQRAEREVLSQGLSHLALRVEDLDAAIRSLDGHGVTWLGEIVPAAAGGQLRSFADLDGNMLQVVQR